jgi:hypothetical protein
VTTPFMLGSQVSVTKQIRNLILLIYNYQNAIVS